MRHRIVLLLISVVWPMGLNAQTGLLISELLYQPRSGEAEYVEFYNASPATVELSDYSLVRWVGDSLGRHYRLPSGLLPSGGYAVFTSSAASVEANYRVKYPQWLIECQLPPFPNTGGSVILATLDTTIVDRFDYSPSMHNPLLHEEAGVSLERRSFARPTHAEGNWASASATAGYGTPGYENSQSTDRMADDGWFELSSTILSPDGDGYQDMLTISYALDRSDLAARIDLYNRQGTLVRRLLNGATLGAAGEVEWDGTDAGGRLVPAGQYVVEIWLYDVTGVVRRVRRVVAVVR